MNVTAGEAVRLFEKHKKIREKAETLTELGLGYLTLGESTPRAFWRGSAAAETGDGAEADAGRRGFRIRRTDDRIAPAGRGRASESV